MTREIKFRAWIKEFDSDEFLMRDVSEMRFDEECLSVNPSGLGGWRDFSEVKLMQFTGLKDKNGTEIYEGDILKWWVKSTNEFSEELLEVLWEQTGFTLFSKLFKRFGLPDGSQCTTEQARQYMRNSEVIGNIYENPDLLKEAQ